MSFLDTGMKNPNEDYGRRRNTRELLQDLRAGYAAVSNLNAGLLSSIHSGAG